MDDVVDLWNKSMEFHKELDREYFSAVTNKGCYFAAKVEKYLDFSDTVLFVLLVDGEVSGFVLANI